MHNARREHTAQPLRLKDEPPVARRTASLHHAVRRATKNARAVLGPMRLFGQCDDLRASLAEIRNAEEALAQ